jgi:hypothetical protein
MVLIYQVCVTQVESNRVRSIASIGIIDDPELLMEAAEW